MLPLEVLLSSENDCFYINKGSDGIYIMNPNLADMVRIKLTLTMISLNRMGQGLPVPAMKAAVMNAKQMLADVKLRRYPCVVKMGRRLPLLAGEEAVIDIVMDGTNAVNITKDGRL